MSRRWPVVGVFVAALVLSLSTVVLGVRLANSPQTGAAAESRGDEASSQPSATTRPIADRDGYAFWDLRDDGTPVRWNPCEPIRWTLRVQGAPDGARALIEQTVARLTDVSGLTFEYVGPTDEEPALYRPTVQPKRYPGGWSPVLLAWTPPHHAEIPLRDSDRGVSMPVAVDGVFISGQIVLNDRRTDLTMDFDDRATSWGATLLHEFVHVLGLDHVDDDDQLMHRFAGSGPVHLGDGDLAGIAALSDDERCLDPGNPRRLQVTVRPRR